MSKNNQLVHIIGAGPAGSVAAISAIRNGLEVTVSEEHQSAGIPRNCSGLFSKEGLEGLKGAGFIDYKKHAINQIRGAHINLAGEAFTVRRSEAVAVVCNRETMDRELAQKASDEGADTRYGECIGEGQPTQPKFRSDNIIGADGPHSFVARHFGFPPIKKYAATLQAEVELRHANDDPHMIEMYLSNTKFPGFFAWVIPHDEYTAEFGVGVESPNRVADAWAHLLKIKRGQFKEKETATKEDSGGSGNGLAGGGIPRPTGFVIPIRARSKTGMRKGKQNVILVGDAAGQTKATTGGGVLFGTTCAAIAGKQALHPHRYEMEWSMKLGADLTMHRLIHRFLASQSDAKLAAFGKRLKKLNFDDYLVEKGNMDNPTRMVQLDLVGHMLRNIGGII